MNGNKLYTSDVVDAVAARMGAYKQDVRELLTEHFPAVLLAALVEGKDVQVAGLGVFRLAFPKQGRPRRDGTPKLRVKFDVSQEIKRELRSRLSEKGVVINNEQP